jgi:cytochrome P450
MRRPRTRWPGRSTCSHAIHCTTTGYARSWRALGDREPEAGDLANLPYLDQVITESMRVYPPVWSVNRTALEPFELASYAFPTGTRAIISQWVIHHLPEVWGDSEVFRPERWDPATGQTLPPGAYFPFGAGPRMCIGMPLADLEARLVLATILQRVTPRMVDGWPVVPMPRVTLRMKHGLRVRLDDAKRSTAAAEALAGVVTDTSR